jgi:glycosyltransferase involved in cell wall biosynthesis
MEPETNETLREGIATYRTWYRPLPIFKASYFIYMWSILRAFRRISQEDFRPDIIHVHVYDAGAPAVLIGKMYGIPVVVSEHFSSFPRRLLGPLDVVKAWLAFRWANMVLPVSYALQEAIRRYGIHARFQVIPNVVDTALFFQKVHCRRNDTDPKRILFVGQLVPVRGVIYLLRALFQLRQKRDDWCLDIVGEGEARMECERLAMNLKLNNKVVFHGLKTKQEVAEFMRGADLFVLPSLCETFSVPAVEALATGTPVLATRCGGPEEFVFKEVGLLVSPGAADSLCAGLDYMLDHLHVYSGDRISAYAREHFSPEGVGAKLHAIYQALRSAQRPGLIS